MESLSDRGAAVAALVHEYDNLKVRSEKLNERAEEVRKKFYDDMHDISTAHQEMLSKMVAIEDTIQKLLKQ